MVHDHAAGFALHALDPADAAEFDRHLSVCPDCDEALEPLMTTAAALAFAGELSQPPPTLRLRIIGLGAPEIPLRRRSERPLLAAVAVAAACAAIVLGLQSSGERQQSAAGLRTYAVRGMDGALLVARSGEAVLVVQDLASPAAGTAYELWIVRDGEAMPAGFLHGRLGVLRRPVPPGATVALSLEPSAGSKRPTGPLLLSVETA